MQLTSLLLLLGAWGSSANPIARDVVDNTAAVGTNPIKVESTQALGILTADNSCSHRDLGFWGPISGVWYAIYGDTSWCAESVTDPSQDPAGVFSGMVRDSVSKATDDPLKVHDLNLNDQTPVAHQKQFVPFNPAWGETSSWGFGGTSICQTSRKNKEAIIFYLRNAGAGGPSDLRGAGVGFIKVIDGAPQVVERYGDQGVWWDSTTKPRYGDAVAYRDEKSRWVYAIGGAPTSVTDPYEASYSYATRVLSADHADLSKYQYYHGPAVGWTYDEPSSYTKETAIFWGAGQGQILWSEYYKCYMFAHLDFMGSKFLLRTAPNPWGPWTADVVAYDVPVTEGNMNAYAGVAHTFLDPNGKTLTVSYTHAGTLPVVKIVFV